MEVQIRSNDKTIKELAGIVSDMFIIPKAKQIKTFSFKYGVWKQMFIKKDKSKSNYDMNKYKF